DGTTGRPVEAGERGADLDEGRDAARVVVRAVVDRVAVDGRADAEVVVVGGVDDDVAAAGAPARDEADDVGGLEAADSCRESRAQPGACGDGPELAGRGARGERVERDGGGVGECGGEAVGDPAAERDGG